MVWCSRFAQVPDKIQLLPRLLTAEDLMPLVASLSDSERNKLLRRIASPRGADDAAYMTAPPARDEFSGDEDPNRLGRGRVG